MAGSYPLWSARMPMWDRESNFTPIRRGKERQTLTSVFPYKSLTPLTKVESKIAPRSFLLALAPTLHPSSPLFPVPDPRPQSSTANARLYSPTACPYCPRPCEICALSIQILTVVESAGRTSSHPFWAWRVEASAMTVDSEAVKSHAAVRITSNSAKSKR